MRTSLTWITAMALIVVGAADAAAGQYPGRSDTGWVDAGKRDCCNEGR
jgi:hypothetical protein